MAALTVLRAGMALLAFAPAVRGQEGPAPVPAPQVAPRPFPATLRPPDAAHAAADTARVYPRTYWAEGGLAGGLVLGTIAGMFAAGFCGYSDTDADCTWAPVTGFLVGAAVGFPVGSLIGGAFRKPPADSAGQGAAPGGNGARLAPLILSSVLTPVGMAVGASQGDSALWTFIGGLVGLATGQLIGRAFR